MRYVITRNNGNPGIYELQEDGSYKVIAHGVGGSSFNAIAEMCKLANMYHSNKQFQGAQSYININGNQVG